MANTNYLQASIAYKTRKADGAPLDINGQLTSVSLRKQAIALLVGTPNPNPLLFEVEFTFTAGGLVLGEPTVKLDPDACPSGYIAISPMRIVLDPTNPTGVFTLTAAGDWQLVGAAPAYAGLSLTSGSTGVFQITATRTATLGQGWVTFKSLANGQTARVYIINVDDLAVWILDTGNWNNLGFYFNTEPWNY